MATPWAKTHKDLKPRRHGVSTTHTKRGSFVPPAIPSTFSFHAPDLFQSIARCTAMKRAPVGLTTALLVSCRPLLRYLVDDIAAVFAFIDDVKDLADAERTAFSGRVGAGVTDLFMQSLGGYVWRDVSEQLIKRPAKGGLADFVYEYVSGEHVLVEAKGSITTSASQSGADSRAKSAFAAQVDPYVYRVPPPMAAGGGPFASIEHGYALAFAAMPGATTSATAAFVAVAEPAHGTGPATPTTSSTVTTMVSTALRRGNYRAVFLLANAPNVVNAIDSFDDDPDAERQNQGFWIVACGGEDFLIGRDPIFPEIEDIPNTCDGWIFAVNLNSGRDFLKVLAAPSGSSTQSQIAARVPFSSSASFIESEDGFAMLRSAMIDNVRQAKWDVTNRTLVIRDLNPAQTWITRGTAPPVGD
ncbi:hypothetical protein [Rhizobium sp. CCGE 510]|uniref:hypothetical protein n=1 Tax=Rhizobium sp. CCGE 510 TaxID=1132836 RepID=UPI00027B8B70|nr:hypothetical protein [Rhizobium sp. CCGE 510]EJT01460.1 hypothetical protein RCCGE510_29456 [Rhizobium sp. CCGE 510]